jgi:hypothetical protein
MLADTTLAGVKKLQLGTTARRVSCPGISPAITISVLRFLGNSCLPGQSKESGAWRTAFNHEDQQVYKVIQELP